MRVKLVYLVAIVACAGITVGQIPLDKYPRDGDSPYSQAIDRFLGLKEDKILGGKPAKTGQFSWQVSLGISWMADAYDGHFCGGSVFDERWIITAAHCVKNRSAWDIIITAGTHELGTSAPRVNVKRIITHKSYQGPPSYDNDIALLELWTPLMLTPNISKVTVIKSDNESEVLKKGAALTVTGWGRTTEQGRTVRILQYLDELPFVERSICNEPLAYNGKISQNMVCAGMRSGGQDSCKGDSGGPLSAEISGKPILAGIVSWGDGCGRPNKVGVYTRVANYTNWIDLCVTNSENCNR